MQPESHCWCPIQLLLPRWKVIHETHTRYCTIILEMGWRLVLEYALWHDCSTLCAFLFCLVFISDSICWFLEERFRSHSMFCLIFCLPCDFIYDIIWGKLRQVLIHISNSLTPQFCIIHATLKFHWTSLPILDGIKVFEVSSYLHSGFHTGRREERERVRNEI